MECAHIVAARDRQGTTSHGRCYLPAGRATVAATLPPSFSQRTSMRSPAVTRGRATSSYTFAEATRDQQMESWLRAHVHAFEYWGGIPALTVPDNTKTGVTKAHRYDPDL